MPIVSVSVDEDLLEELKSMEEDLGFGGRSELFRSALRSFIKENKDLEDLEGETSCVLIVEHENNAKLDIHEFQGLVSSQLHSHDHEGDCIQIFVLEGDAEGVVEMKNLLEANKKVTKTELVGY